MVIDMMRYGFTGTQHGMSDGQRMVVGSLLNIFAVTECPVLNHGCCVGADALAHAMAITRGYRVRLFPSNIKEKTAVCPGAEWCDEEWPPLQRNHHIVENSDRMIAAPRTMANAQSGTWATINAARRYLRPLVIVTPEGKLQFERWPQTW